MLTTIASYLVVLVIGVGLGVWADRSESKLIAWVKSLFSKV